MGEIALMCVLLAGECIARSIAGYVESLNLVVKRSTEVLHQV